MSMQKKVIGRMPTDHGTYDPQLAYGKKFTVTLFDCGWESKHDNNTTAPATLNELAGTITPNIEHWIHRWGSYNQWLIDNGYKNIDASDVKDGNQSQHTINAALIGEIGTDSAPGTVKGRIKTLENSVGSGGSVDQRIAQAKSDVIGGASSSGNTLKKVEDRVSPLEKAVGSGGSIDSRISSAVGAEKSRAETAEADRYTKSETYTKSEVNGLVDTPHQEYVTVDAYSNLPATGSKDTVYRVSNYNGSTSQVDASVYSEYAWNGSQYIFLCVKSQIGEVFDISVYNNNAKYADLAAALNGGANIPQSLQKGGMSVKFVHTSDNKYVQCRLMADEFTTDTTQWAIAEEGVYVENPEFVYVKTDKDGKILLAIKTDGGIYYGAGCPQQVKDYINERTPELIDNPEFIQVTTDSEDKILEGVTSRGVKQINIPIDTPSANIEHIDSLEFIQVTTDREGKIISYRDKEGVLYEDAGIKTKNINTDTFTGNTIQINDELKLSLNAKQKLKEELETQSNNAGLVLNLSVIMNLPIPHPTDNNGKELYSTLPIYNVERRAKQFRDVEWTPLSPIPTITGSYLPEGVSRQGLPYSSCMEVDKMVGFDITLLTFMTAANNPYSMLYTENLRDKGSVYGFTYHSSRGTIAGWSGVVCNVFVEHSIGMAIPHDTGEWAYLSKIGKLVEVYDNSAQGLCVGDMLWEEGHGRLAQNLWRTAKGLVTLVEVTENAQHNSTMYETKYASPEIHYSDFDEDLDNRHGKIYRYPKLYENINYTPSPFVILEGETQTPYIYNDDICTYAGDYACFREGFRIVLNYNLKEDKSWESVELYKNDELMGTYRLSEDAGTYDRGPENYPAEKAEVLPSHSFDLSFLNLTKGKYKARLVDSSNNYSDYTNFEILDTSVSYINNNNITHVIFNSVQGSPLFVRFHKQDGGPKAIYEFTSKDIENGYCDIDVSELIKQQHNNYAAGKTYMKVYFEGEYGRVTNEPIEFNL